MKIFSTPPPKHGPENAGRHRSIDPIAQIRTQGLMPSAFATGIAPPALHGRPILASGGEWDGEKEREEKEITKSSKQTKHFHNEGHPGAAFLSFFSYYTRI